MFGRNRKSKDQRAPLSPSSEPKIRKRFHGNLQRESQHRQALKVKNFPERSACDTSPCSTGPLPTRELCVTGQSTRACSPAPTLRVPGTQTHGTTPDPPVKANPGRREPRREPPKQAKPNADRARRNELEHTAVQLTSSHMQMDAVLSSRLLKLRVAHTFWKRGWRDLVSHLHKVQDDSLVNDLLPCLTESVQHKSLSLELCADLSANLIPLLSSKHDSYVHRCLQFVQTLVQDRRDEIEQLLIDPGCNEQCFTRALLPFLRRVQRSTRMNELAHGSGYAATTARTLQLCLRQLL